MLKKRLLTAAFISTLLCFSLAGTMFVNLGTATIPIAVSIPESSAYAVTNYNAYNANEITLYFLVDYDSNYKGAPIRTAWYGYSLDGQATVTFTPSYQTFEYHYYSNGGKSVTEINGINLYSLAEGTHSIVVYVKMNEIRGCVPPIDYGSTLNASNTKLFTIDTTLPSVAVLTPVNRIYNTSEVPLNFTVSEPCSQITYRLNEQPNVTVDGNGTLTLVGGEYNLTVFASDIAGNIGASETINFTINQKVEPETKQSEPFPITLISAAVITVSVVGSGLIFYFKKRKR